MILDTISPQETKKSSKFPNVLISFGIPLVILVLTAYLGFIIFQIYKKTSYSHPKPAEVINIKDHFSGNVYFNDELGKSTFTDLIVKNINSAQKRIELAMYSFNNTQIAEALGSASDRGIEVHLIFSDKNASKTQSIFQPKYKNIKISFVASKNESYMHNKFLLVDRGDANQKILFGSSNFTNTQENFDPSFIFESDRPELVNVFGGEFDYLSLKAQKKDMSNIVHKPFAARINYPEGFIEIWFTPQSADNNLKQRMLDLIKNSKNNIKVMIWYLTDKDIAASLISAAANKPVTIITDDYNWSSSGSVFPILTAQKQRQNLNQLEMINDSKRNQQVAEILKGKSINSFLHHHLLIIDDQTAVFGTNNWTSGGFSRNSESIMISNIPSLVSAFADSYSFNYKTNK